MTRFVLDPATLVHVARNDLEPRPTHQLLGPGPLRTHALELLLREVNAGTLEEREALRLHERITGIKLRLLSDRVSRRTAWNLAREFGWDHLADAEYLAVTRLQADALIATDPGLRARAEGVVPLAGIDALFADG